MHTTRTLAAAAAVVGLSLTALPASAADRTAPTRSDSGVPTTCRGMEADIAYPDEEFIGTWGDDVIVVLSPYAEVYGQGGNDTICVYGNHAEPYHGSDVHGGPGDDVIISYSGSHYLTGDGDRDVIIANGGAHEVEGGDGNDVINVGGATSGWVHAGAGNDIVTGSPGGDTIFGNAGNDLLMGFGGNDTIHGDDGNDTIYGGKGWDGIGGGIHYDSCIDVASLTNGAMFGDCEDVTLTPDGPGGLAGG